jgi:hypothetical protein
MDLHRLVEYQGDGVGGDGRGRSGYTRGWEAPRREGADKSGEEA